MRYSGIIVTALAIFGLLLTGFQDAEARRLGGGRSFGSRPSYTSPYQRSVTPGKQVGRQPQSAQQHNAQRRANLASRGGLWGMLGGLALGGLLGALFFGGAFEGINFLDILIFAGVAFLLYKLLVARRRPPPAHAGTAPGGLFGAGMGTGGYGTSATGPADAEAEVRRSWDLDTPAMRRKFGTGNSSPGTRLAPAEQDTDADFAPDFDQPAFLEGAKRAYRMLQEAWDREDLETLRALTTNAVFGELQSQLAERHGDNRTVVLSLEAELLEARQAHDQIEATVLFDAYLREVDTNVDSGDRGHQVREVWHFVRRLDTDTPTWYLDGIQQLED
jgi:predicted lipid-binding transport protein (Tim44 family)